MRRLLLCLLIATGCGTASIPLPTPSQAELSDATVTRGEYIVRTAAVCTHCHENDLRGGREFRNWRVGVARASNLTSDVETGLGAWSDAEIVRALRNGVRRDGRVLIPVMPYEWLHEMSDSDAFAVARYLKSVKPVRNAVHQSPNLIYRIGRPFFVKPLPPAPPRNMERGEYLSQHVALCADCHTPRGGIRQKADRSRLFAGMAKPPKGFPANPSNLTPDNETGIGKWSEADFLKTLRTGVNPDGKKLHPFMPREVGGMTDDDLGAIYRYLRTLKPIRNPIPRSTMPP